MLQVRLILRGACYKLLEISEAISGTKGATEFRHECDNSLDAVPGLRCGNGEDKNSPGSLWLREMEQLQMHLRPL